MYFFLHINEPGYRSINLGLSWLTCLGPILNSSQSPPIQIRPKIIPSRHPSLVHITSPHRPPKSPPPSPPKHSTTPKSPIPLSSLLSRQERKNAKKRPRSRERPWIGSGGRAHPPPPRRCGRAGGARCRRQCRSRCRCRRRRRAPVLAPPPPPPPRCGRVRDHRRRRPTPPGSPSPAVAPGHQTSPGAAAAAAATSTRPSPR